MKVSFFLVIIGAFYWLNGAAQQTAGTSGCLLNTPSADFNPDGTFSFGSNYLPETVMPGRLDYSTGNFFLNITYFSFLELTYRMTLLKMERNDNKMTNQDRSVSVRVRLLKESKILPAFVVGGNDILTSSFLTVFANNKNVNQYFGSLYGVATKNIPLSGNIIGLTLGYEYAHNEAPQFSGVMAGVRFSPAFYKPLSIIVEYDSFNVNAGVSILLFKHFYFQTFTSEFNNISVGIAYRGQLKTLKNN